MEARIHIVDPAPPYCAACYQAVPEKRHVDFGASTDGAVLPAALNDAVGVVGHVIDEIVVCETCIAHAADLIGLGDVAELKERLAVSEARNDQLHAQLEATRAAVVESLEDVKRRLVGEATPPPTSPNASLPLPGKRSSKKRPARR